MTLPKGKALKPFEFNASNWLHWSLVTVYVHVPVLYLCLSKVEYSHGTAYSSKFTTAKYIYVWSNAEFWTFEKKIKTICLIFWHVKSSGEGVVVWLWPCIEVSGF